MWPLRFQRARPRLRDTPQGRRRSRRQRRRRRPRRPESCEPPSRDGTERPRRSRIGPSGSVLGWPSRSINACARWSRSGPGSLRHCGSAIRTASSLSSGDPPRRWRLEVEEAGTSTTAIVAGRDGILCEQPNGAEASCRPRSLDALLTDVPFRELIVDAVSTARGVHLSPGAPVTVTTDMVAGVLVRCFERQSGSSAVRWCFAGDGALLSITLETEGRAPTIIEATRVSHAVDDARFDQLRLGF